MSIEAAHSIDAIEREFDRRSIRLALAVAVCFAVTETLDWWFAFLPPVLTVVMLATPGRFTLKQGVGMLVVVGGALALALVITAGLITSPWLLLLVVGFVLFWTFYAQARGVPDGPLFLIQIAFCAVAVLGSINWAVAQEFAQALTQSVAVAAIIAMAAHTVMPNRIEPPRPPRPPALPPGGNAVWQAAGRLLVVLPLLSLFVLDANHNGVICMIATLRVVRRFETGMGGLTAKSLIIGNVIGGVLASLVYNVTVLHSTIVFFFLMVLLVGLVVAPGIARGGQTFLEFRYEFTTFLLVLGEGLSPLPGGSEETFATRLTNILLASTYAVLAMALVMGTKTLSSAPVEEPGGERDPGGGQRRDTPA